MIFSDFLAFCLKKSITFTLIDEQLKINAPKNVLTADIIEMLRQFKPELMAWLHDQEEANAILSVPPLIRSEVRDMSLHIPVSVAQEQMWLAHKLNDLGDSYHFSRVLNLYGKLDISALEKSFQIIFDRHQCLRTVFIEEGGKLHQKVLDNIPSHIPFSDLSSLNASDRAKQLDALKKNLISSKFILDKDLMLRLHLVFLDSGCYQLIVVLHHIASDGWSLGVLISEFQDLYSHFVQNTQLSLRELSVSYSDYSLSQRSLLDNDFYISSIDYWRNKLIDVNPIHSLPMDRVRKALRSFDGSHFYQKIEGSHKKSLLQMAAQTNSTLFMVLETLFSIFISRFSNSQEVIFGTPVANRAKSEIENIIGYFVNVVALRHQVDDTQSFYQTLSHTKKDVIDAFKHQHVPFEIVLREVVKSRSISYSPLIQILFVLQNNEIPDIKLPNIFCQIETPNKTNCFFDLELEATESSTGIDICWRYSTELFNGSTIIRMADSFDQLIKAVIENPDSPVGRLNILSHQVNHQLLVEWNNTAMEYPQDHCIHHLFEARAEQHPEAVAVMFEDRQLTYGELNQQANRLAHYLISEKHITPDTLVGICVERSLEMVIGIIAILKAGGAYVPLDPEYPEARLKYMLDDASLTTVLTQRHLRETTPVSDEQAVCLDDGEFEQVLASYASVNPRPLGLTPQHLAYVIYTSGSTGNPKGVMVEHQNISGVLLGLTDTFGVTATDSFAFLASVAFDIALFEMFVTLIKGGNTIIINRDTLLDLERLTDAIRPCTLVHAVPSLMNEIVDYKQTTPSCLPNVRRVFVGGDQVPHSLIVKLKNNFKQAEVIELYGPTECTILTTFHNASLNIAIHSGSIIGRGLANTHLFVLDSLQHPTPHGIAGELHIGGCGITRGYLNRPELTAEKFIRNPFYDKDNPASSECLYKTGDLVRWHRDGNLEFLGRIDHQVKIRGFRIELGEIENTLSRHTAVKESIVIAKESATTNDKRLVAYVVTDAENLEDDSETAHSARLKLVESMRVHVGETLPDYMVPSAFILLAALPLTPNGKIDRKALPEPQISDLQTTYVAPSTNTEKTLCDIWQQILGLERVGIMDNFFQIGGHSLLAVKLCSAINEVFHTNIKIKEIFEATTIALMAKVIDCELITKTLIVDDGAESLGEEEWLI